MEEKFSAQLAFYIDQSGLPVRRIASQAGIPHQTLHNWLRGKQPRLHAALPGDLYRLGATLSLAGDQIMELLQLAGCTPEETGNYAEQEASMKRSHRIPSGWEFDGMAPERYDVGPDPLMTYEGMPSITIKAGPDPSGFASLCQTFKAKAYRGKRLRFSAAVRTEGVENAAALFMRVDDAREHILAFDNMRDRQITGTTDWARYAIVLDIADKAEYILFGSFLSMHGQLWMADIHIDVVGPEVPTTDIFESMIPDAPVNLEFEE